MNLTPTNPMRVVLLSILLFEAIAFALAVPVMIRVSGVGLGASLGFAGGAALLALVATAMMRRPVGYPLGWLTQVVGLTLGFLTPAMFVVGLLFLALWVLTFVLGKRLEAQWRAHGS